MTERFYEGVCPPFEYEPLMQDFEIVDDTTVGHGLRTKKAFAPGDIVFRFWGEKTTELSLYTLQHPDGHHILDPVVMGKVLHSCDPNMSCDMYQQIFTAYRTIQPGDYLTMDYLETETTLFRPFYCSCGSPLCRKWIAGRVNTTAS